MKCLSAFSPNQRNTRLGWGKTSCTSALEQIAVIFFLVVFSVVCATIIATGRPPLRKIMKKAKDLFVGV